MDWFGVPEFMKCSGGTAANPGHSYNFENGQCSTCLNKLSIIDEKLQGKVFNLKISRPPERESE